jgi:hypothetical protein
MLQVEAENKGRFSPFGLVAIERLLGGASDPAL